MKKFAKNIIRRLRSATLAFLLSWKENKSANPVTELAAYPYNALSVTDQEEVYEEIRKTQEAKMILERMANSLMKSEAEEIDDWLHRHLERVFGKEILKMYHDERRRIPNVETHFHVNWDTRSMRKITRVRIYVKEKRIAECEVVVSETFDVPYHKREDGEVLVKGWRVNLKEISL